MYNQVGQEQIPFARVAQQKTALEWFSEGFCEPPLKQQCTELPAGLRDTDHLDWCHAKSGDMVIGIHGGIYEVRFNGYGKYDGGRPMKNPITRLMAHGNFVPIFADAPSAAQSRPPGKFLSLMAGS